MASTYLRLLCVRVGVRVSVAFKYNVLQLVTKEKKCQAFTDSILNAKDLLHPSPCNVIFTQHGSV